jgi:hypothetical protein
MTGMPWRTKESNSASPQPQAPSPQTIHVSLPGRAKAAPMAKPAPTPSVPKAPGSSQDSGARGCKT